MLDSRRWNLSSLVSLLTWCVLFILSGGGHGVAADLNLPVAANTSEFRFLDVKPNSSTGKPGFISLDSQNTGITFTNLVPASRHYTNQILLNGSGVAAGDIDGDGWCDLFFCGLGGGSRFYRNEGNWKFRDITASSGLGHAGAQSSAGILPANFDATGAAIADLDGDGDLDLIVNSVGQGTLSCLNDGKGRFTRSALLNPNRCGTSLALADVDGDGALDIYIANYRISTIRDQPGARFTFNEVNGQPQPVSFGGRPLTDPDLTNRFAFVYRPRPGGGGTVLHDELGEADVLYRNQGGGRFAAVSDDTFTDHARKPISQPPLDWGLSVIMRDFNGDGMPDIYVCNDFATPDRFWLNDGTGRFYLAPQAALRQTSLSTMAIDVADINRDGFDDFFTADMLSRERWRRLVQHNVPNPNMHLFVDVTRQPQSARNTLQLGRGDGTYAEVAQLAGVEAAEWAWASIFLDVDLDGYEDLLVANGFERDYMNMDAHRKVQALQASAARGPRPPNVDSRPSNPLSLYPRLNTGNVAFRNMGGLRFADLSAEWGFDQRAVSQGMCLADLDNDGDMDIAINNSNDPATILRNDTLAPRVAVRLKGRSPNPRGIGARVRLLNGAIPSQSQEILCGGRYLSSDDPMRVFAAGSTTNDMTVEVFWRSGTRSTLHNVSANRIYEIHEPPSSSKVPPPALTLDSRPSALDRARPHFQDVSSLISHTDSQETFDDFGRQPLLPYKLSTLGPGVTWFDVDADGWDDLIAAGGGGKNPTIYRSNRNGGFTNLHLGAQASVLHATILGYISGAGETDVLAGSRKYEMAPGSAAIAEQFSITTNITSSAFVIGHSSLAIPPPSNNQHPLSTTSAGPMALCDVDGDGQLDLFVGGRSVPGRWPEPAPSFLFRQLDGKWTLDQENTARLNKHPSSTDRTASSSGMASGAVFTDIDNDGDSELVVACEWGPLRVFRNERGALTDATAELGLASYTGWWNGVSAGDFDGDGRMDLIASNYGRNTKHERFRSKPLRIYYGDFNGDGSVIPIESWYDDSLRGYAPTLNVWTMSRSMPWLLEKFSSYEAFSRVTVEQALGERGRNARYLEAAWLESSVFLNRGGRFEIRPLPIEAQIAPAFAVCVADFDGDGHEDAFLSQNLFATRTETSRYDAGRGLLLLGHGNGDFTPVSGQQSGLLIYGEQRGAASADYDADGRTDLAVAQVGSQTKLYRNDRARPGLRVRLKGTKANPLGIGAALRLRSVSEGRVTTSPAREVRAGSGYWSQDGAVQVMSVAAGVNLQPLAVQVRWPGGKVTEAKVPPDALEVTVDLDGGIKRIR